jgi:hypothetical protein
LTAPAQRYKSALLMAFRSAERCASLGLLLAACVQSASTYPLTPEKAAPAVSGVVQLEGAEGGHTLVVVELRDLPPPEHFASGLTEFAVWLTDAQGRAVKLGALRYDRARLSGSLLGQTKLRAFTVRVTGERHSQAQTPSDVVVASRKVTNL